MADLVFQQQTLKDRRKVKIDFYLCLQGSVFIISLWKWLWPDLNPNLPSVSSEPVPLWEMGKVLIFQRDKLGAARKGKENYPICVEGLISKSYLSEGKPLPFSAICLMWDTKIHPELHREIRSALLDCSNKRNICYSPPLRKFISLKIASVNHSFFTFPLKIGRFSR